MYNGYLCNSDFDVRSGLCTNISSTWVSAITTSAVPTDFVKSVGNYHRSCAYKGLVPFLNSTISTGYVRAITSLARAIQNTRDRSFVFETKARGKSGSFRKIKKTDKKLEKVIGRIHLLVKKFRKRNVEFQNELIVNTPIGHSPIVSNTNSSQEGSIYVCIILDQLS